MMQILSPYRWKKMQVPIPFARDTINWPCNFIQIRINTPRLKLLSSLFLRHIFAYLMLKREKPERHKNFCFECKRIPYTSHNVVAPGNSNGSGFKVWNIISRSKPCKLWRNIRDIRDRFREEAKVIDDCLHANSMMSRKEPSLYNPLDYIQRSKSLHRFEKETLVFNPSDYLHLGYPHLRNQIYKNSATFWFLQTQSMLHNDNGGTK
ncbi:hypothetical protein Lal_00006869 [Lupinus albus]|nr:hypothetical protein Lal_00006869 [Lupinus albus]